MFQAMATEASYDNPDDWELINDDGFVYKRKKRPRLEPIVAAPPASEQNHRLLRQKRALLKLRDRYLEEISRWELLSNTLTAMEQNASAQLMERHELHPSTSSDGASSSSEPSAADFYRRRLVDDLLSQVKEQEAIIVNVSNMCDIAQVLCSAKEGIVRQQLIDLPIWDPSPQELMAALVLELEWVVAWWSSGGFGCSYEASALCMQVCS
ncbi:uncharacterized protein LOC125215755 isoform X1 [Salvia hispanica]|uniref:uncharacterized protein LOC125215755 isoform X1 n=1 Tax=Salvia hispanica TaxID=49212 RepID=UPI002009D67E|nr:uncharacterized protein LOC125215755 isoform X1 [Salvia hispanica]